MDPKWKWKDRSCKNTHYPSWELTTWLQHIFNLEIDVNDLILLGKCPLKIFYDKKKREKIDAFKFSSMWFWHPLYTHILLGLKSSNHITASIFNSKWNISPLMIKTFHYITVLIFYVVLPWTLAEESTLQQGEKSNFYLLEVKDSVTEVNSLERNIIPVRKGKHKLWIPTFTPSPCHKIPRVTGYLGEYFHWIS